jgi:aquaporin Z
VRAHERLQLRERPLCALEHRSIAAVGDQRAGQRMAQTAAPLRQSKSLSRLRRNWPEYLIEGWALGMFMISAGLFAILLDYPGSPVHQAINDATTRRILAGIAMGLTAIALIYSPWGKRSGAHMNPAVTLAFLRLRKIDARDAMFFVLAQFIGGTLGVLLVAQLVGPAFTAPPVSYAATLPGAHGPVVAFIAEALISAFLIFTILTISNTPRIAHFAGIAAGCLVATYIALEAPLSGMSMNPARTFASAMPGLMWQGFWIYITAPVLGMLAGAELFMFTRGRDGAGCAKLLHPADQRCIHCGHEPAASARNSTP